MFKQKFWIHISFRICIVVIVACLGLSHSIAQEKSKGTEKPKGTAGGATPDQAAKVLDLSKFALVGTEPEINHQVIASQSYTTKGKVVDITKAILKSLKDAGFKESEGTMVTDAYSSAMLTKSGFTFSITVTPGSMPDRVGVNIQNFGNVDLKKLPLPKNCKQVYAMPNTILYQCESSVADATKEIRVLMAREGWKPYGEVVGSIYFKNNAVKLMFSISEAAGLGGKTAIQVMAEQLSLDLPAPPDATTVQYADSVGNILVDTPSSQDKVIAFYRDELKNLGWEPTTENVIRIDFHDHMIFRNKSKELLDLEIYEVEGVTRVSMKHDSAEEVERQNEVAKKMAADAKKKMEDSKIIPKIALKIPADFKFKNNGKDTIEFEVKPGTAAETAKKLLKAFEADGWNVKSNVQIKEAGDIDLEKDKTKLDLSYTDPGFIEATLTLSVFGKGELVIEKQK